ncbi:C-type lectin domain family 2 member D-like isoform X2 [Oxyura jamaicensis]|uniref:C-type lectin domain family 2 member D-like isoform X2 n=1 Tax=Oxyura jamaicensis TaxID=8884 RepID=UPI0015A5F468|nr:C-type lectin domain family 2 member D-like isoform X2 [Oxyura jamaicensis]
MSLERASLNDDERSYHSCFPNPYFLSLLVKTVVPEHVGILTAVIILLLVLGVGLTLLYCPQHWKRNGRKCYFFSQTTEGKNWTAFHDECTGMYSELVTIDKKKELDYLISQSTGHYYLLGLQYKESKKWEWINGREHSTDLFNITGPSDYFCTVVGFGQVSTAPRYESSTTKNMCEKSASISEKAEEEPQKTDSMRNFTPTFV